MEIKDQRPVVKALLNYAKKMDDWVRPIDNTRKFHHRLQMLSSWV